MRRTRTIALCYLFALVLSADAFAQTYNGAVAVTVENDTFTGSDNNYTNGLGLSWGSKELKQYREDSFVRSWGEFWSFLPLGGAGSQRFVSWTLAQEMFTPDDIKNPNPPPDDQPYAGMLYVDSVIFARDARAARIWYLRLGIVGPSSGSEEVQTQFHEAIGADRPQGWDTQFPDEPIVNIGHHSGHLWLQGDWGDSASWRVVPMANLDLGNYYTGASLRLYNEFGWNLPMALGVGSLRHGLATGSMLGAAPMAGWSFSIFVSFGGYAVAHYLPIDGTVLKESRSIDTEPFIGALEGGFSLRKGAFVLGYQRAGFSTVFDSQRQAIEFGTVTIGWYY